MGPNIFIKKIVFDTNTAKIRITSKPQGTTRRVAYVSGYGKISSEGGFANDLQAAAVTEVLHEDCNYYNGGQITERLICFGDYEKYACKGNFGGLLVDKNRNEQLGVASWAYSCADTRYPIVYTNIDYFNCWITSRSGRH
ncbi:hypothetical protein FQA39_LY16123 [Lamprigera yunnana]|nr:hypothetical protein FQA39_LY16123 [Lamprigera yunnana]